MAEQLSLMGIYAHPDDEQGVSGSMIKYRKMGVRTSLVVATRGEEGEIAPGVKATKENLGAVREQEMRCAAEKLGLDSLYFLDYCDSGMAGTAANQSLLSFHQAPILDVSEKVTRIVRRERPQVIATFEPWGGYGHPDHIKIHQAALIAFFGAGDQRAFPQQLQAEGLKAWAPQKLYYGAFSRSRLSKLLDAIKLGGGAIPNRFEEFVKRATPDEAITTEIDVAEFGEQKLASLKCHASQLGPDTPFARLPEQFQRERMTTETFILSEARIPRPFELERDLFAGLTENA